MDNIWNKYVDKNPEFKDLNKEEVKKVQNTFDYRKFELRCAIDQLLDDIKSRLKEIFKNPEPISFSKEVPPANFKPPKDPEPQIINKTVGDEILDIAEEMELDGIEKLLNFHQVKKLDRDLTEEEKDIINTSLLLGVAYGIGLYRKELKGE